MKICVANSVLLFLGISMKLFLQTSAAPDPEPKPEPEPYIYNGVNINLNGASMSNGENSIGAQKDVKCGIKGPSATRIVNGKPVNSAAKYSWQVGLSMDMYPYYEVECGGSIITNKHILTAAHCLPVDYVGIGSNKQSNTNDIVSVGRVFVHEDYEVTPHDNDIAIIELSVPIDLAKHSISPICIPGNDANDYAGSIATVTGWGSTVGYNPKPAPRPPPHYPNILQEAQVPVINNTDCEKVYDDFTERMLCTGGLVGFDNNGTSPCQGDSGGPLVVEENGQYQQIGIVSWAYGCASLGYPNVYTRVTKFLDWINNIIYQPVNKV